jgi:hypothetical protein
MVGRSVPFWFWCQVIPSRKVSSFFTGRLFCTSLSLIFHLGKDCLYPLFVYGEAYFSFAERLMLFLGRVCLYVGSSFLFPLPLGERVKVRGDKEQLV